MFLCEVKRFFCWPTIHIRFLEEGNGLKKSLKQEVAQWPLYSRKVVMNDSFFLEETGIFFPFFK